MKPTNFSTSIVESILVSFVVLCLSVRSVYTCLWRWSCFVIHVKLLHFVLDILTVPSMEDSQFCSNGVHYLISDKCYYLTAVELQQWWYLAAYSVCMWWNCLQPQLHLIYCWTDFLNSISPVDASVPWVLCMNLHQFYSKNGWVYNITYC